MKAPLALLGLSTAMILVALIFADLSDLLLLGVPAWIGSLFLLVEALRTTRNKARQATANPIIIDGSNVMHWSNGTPSLEPLRAVVGMLQDRGYSPGVVFDANAGYLLLGKYQHDHALGQLLGLADDKVMVVDKGTSADPMILRCARDLGARVITNDRFRDWAHAFPEVAQPGFLIRGGFRQGHIWLDLEAKARDRQMRKTA